MSDFQIGEIAIYSPTDLDGASPLMRECVGMGCEIIEKTLPRYRVRMADGDMARVYPCSLRKKRPPKEDTCTWEDIERTTKGWNPNKVLEQMEVEQ